MMTHEDKLEDMAKRDERFQSTLVALRAQVTDSFEYGESLPSIRTLAATHGVGTDMIKRVLRVLSEESLVKVFPGRGSFKNARLRSAPKSSLDKNLKIALLTSRNTVELPKYPIYRALQDEAISRNLELLLLANPHTFRLVPHRELIQIERVPWNTFDVALLVETEQTIPLFASKLQQHNVLAVDQDATRFGINSVCFADYEAGAMAARYLLSLGHMRFAMLDEYTTPGFACDPAWTARNCGFENTVREHGANMLPEWRISIARKSKLKYASFSKETIARWATAPRAERPTALFAMSFLYMPEIIQELVRHRFHIPNEISVIVPSTNGQIIKIERLSYTCVDFGLTTLARQTFDVVFELRTAENTSSITIEPKLSFVPAVLVPGQSTAPPCA
jgi:DNA-binding LacI/PurR family transcriptional regulator